MTRARPRFAPAKPLLAALIASLSLISPAAAQTEAPDAAAAPQEAPAAQAEPNSEATPEGGPSYAADDVVATVGETKILLDEVVSVYASLPENVQALPEETLWEGIVSQLIDETAISAAGLEAGLADRRDVALTINAQRRAILANAYLESVITAKLTDEVIEAEYRKRFVDVEPVKQVRASHILLNDEETAKGVLAEIRGGKEFAEAAKEHSTGPTGPGGGDLGYFEKEQMVPEFAEAAFAMQAGEVSEPVKSDFGWHIINVVDIRDRPAPDFESARATINEELSVQYAQEIVAELRAGAQIERRIEAAPEGALRDVALIAPPSADSGADAPAQSEEKAPITDVAPDNAPAPAPSPAAQ